MRELTFDEIEVVSGGIAPWAAACLTGGAVDAGVYSFGNWSNGQHVNFASALSHFGAGCANGVLAISGAPLLALVGEFATNAAIQHYDNNYQSQNSASQHHGHHGHHHSSASHGHQSLNGNWQSVIVVGGYQGEPRPSPNTRQAHM